MNFFGYTYGLSPDEYKNGYAAAAKESGAWGLTPDHLGLRVKFSAVGWTPSGVLFNGGASNLTSIGNSDITQMSITYDGGSIDYSFPTNFRYGAVPTVYAPGEILPLSGGADVKIKAPHYGEDWFFLDFLVPTAYLNEDRYFIYDPDVTVCTGPLCAGQSGVCPAGCVRDTPGRRQLLFAATPGCPPGCVRAL